MADVGGAEVEGGEDGDSKCMMMYCNQFVAGTCELLIAWLCVQASISSTTSHSSHFRLVRSWGDHPTGCTPS